MASQEYGTLQPEEALFEAAPEILPSVVLATLTEPLRTAPTGRDAIHGLLEIAMSLRNPGARSLTRGGKPDAQTIYGCGKSLEYHIRDRFERSVYEGELPEGANVGAMSALTLTVVRGLVFCTQDSAATLLDSLKLFVNGLGFHVPGSAKRRPRPLAPVLQFVRRSVL